MTYNFDPERWLTMQRLALESRAERGEIKPAELQDQIRAAELRYEEMVERLDGTFDISPPEAG